MPARVLTGAATSTSMRRGRTDADAQLEHGLTRLAGSSSRRSIAGASAAAVQVRGRAGVAQLQTVADAGRSRHADDGRGLRALVLSDRRGAVRVLRPEDEQAAHQGSLSAHPEEER